MTGEEYYSILKALVADNTKRATVSLKRENLSLVIEWLEQREEDHKITLTKAVREVGRLKRKMK